MLRITQPPLNQLFVQHVNHIKVDYVLNMLHVFRATAGPQQEKHPCYINMLNSLV